MLKKLLVLVAGILLFGALADDELFAQTTIPVENCANVVVSRATTRDLPALLDDAECFGRRARNASQSQVTRLERARELAVQVQPAEPEQPGPVDPTPDDEAEPADPEPEPEPAVIVPTAEWSRCAPENGICRFEGTAEVRYGAGQTWRVRIEQGSVDCTNERFGGDPALNVVKACDVRTLQPPGTSDPIPVPEGPATGTDPMALLTEFQPRLAELGYRLVIGPPVPSNVAAAPGELRWDVTLVGPELVDHPQRETADRERLLYAVFAPPGGSELAMTEARGLAQQYLDRATAHPAR